MSYLGGSIRNVLPVFLAGLVVAGGAAVEQVDSDPKPWTDAGFLNDSADFQFAIVSDRCGGHRQGVFADAIKKLNLLRPEFVMSVGDLIEGYTEEREEAEEEWAEVQAMIAELDMRFFYVPGNHDIGQEATAETWDALYGERYYSFVYKDVLFMCLNAIDGEGGSYELGPAQLEWARSTLAAHPDARWTLLFMHVPLWLNDEGNSKSARKTIENRTNTGFEELQGMLEGRDYTVFAGHYHQYFRYRRCGQNYYILSATGGDSKLRGLEHGEFDHVVWVTMTDDGPVVANLLLDGILPDDVHTEEHMMAANSVTSRGGPLTVLEVPFSADLTIEVTNVFDTAMNAAMTWRIPGESGWSINPATAAMDIVSRAAGTADFKVAYEGNRRDIFPLPALEVRSTTAGGNPIRQQMELPMDKQVFLAADLPEVTCRRTKEPIVSDGVLAEEEWGRSPDIDDMQEIGLSGIPVTPTKAWLAYDDENLYVAAKCLEPNLAGLLVSATERDGACWADDSVELFIDMGQTRKIYQQIVVNAKGVIFDSLNKDVAWNGEYKVAAGREADGWTMELTVPWTTLETKASDVPGSVMGFEFVRSRPQSGEMVQWAPTAGGNHTPSLFGTVRFED